ncbi:unnamed protein product, partial [Brassica napus]
LQTRRQQRRSSVSSGGWLPCRRRKLLLPSSWLFFAPVFHLLVGADMLGVLVDVSRRNPNSAPGRAISGGLRPLPGISARRQRFWLSPLFSFMFYWRLSLWRGPVTSLNWRLVSCLAKGFVHRSMEATALLREAPSSMAVSFSSRRPPSICQTLLISVIVFWVLWSRFLLSASSASLDSPSV